MKYAVLLILTFTILTGCMAEKGKTIVNLNRKLKNATAKNLNASVSLVKIVNHQLIVTGANLSDVSNVVVNGNSFTENFTIESISATQIIANSVRNFSFDVSKIFDLILSNANASATFSIDFSLCNSTLGGKGIDCSTVPLDKQVLSYDQTSGKWKPRDVNGLNYIGVFDASSGANPAIKPAGQYYIISVAGDINAGATTLGVGDWIVSNGTIWQKIDNSTVITSVHGRTGAVVGAEGDYTLNQLSDVTLTAPAVNEILKYNGTNWVNSNLSALGGGTVTSVSASAPLGVTNGTSTPALTISQATTSTNGYLTSTDWNTFNGKQAVIAAGTTAQYYRGDKTWQTLDTSAVPENANIYFTNARALGVPLAGFSAATATAITSTDTILAAFGKAQGQINNLTASGSGYVAIVGGSTMAGTTTVSGVIDATTTGDVRVGAPAGATSAVSKSYVDTAAALKLSKAGDTMSGALNLDADLKIKGTTNYVTLKANSATSTYNFTLPVDGGANGQVLTTDGSGLLTWSTPVSAAPVTSVNTLTGAIVLTTTNIAEGSNLYSTTARTLAAPITAPTLTNAAITTSDTIQVALGKLQGQFNNILSLALTGYTAGSNAVLAATDTILAAFGKLQGQISANTTSLANKADLTNGAQSITASNITTTTINGAAFVNGNWTTSGSDVYRSGGNVGIGTATPGQKLTVAGTIESTSGGIKFPDGTTQLTSATGGGSSASYDSGWFNIACDKTYQLSLGFSGFPKHVNAYYKLPSGEIHVWGLNHYGDSYQENGVTLDYDGSGSIYVRAPSTNGSYACTLFHVGYYRNRADSGFDNLFGLSTGIQFRVIASDGAGGTQWSTTGSSLSYTGGNVGVGTTSPAQKLSVAGTIESTSGGIKYPDGSTQATSSFGPVFSAYTNTATSTSSSTWVKILYNQVDFDSDGSLDTANSRIKPTKAGYYRITMNLYLNQTISGGMTNYFSLYKNGSPIRNIANLQNYNSTYSQSLQITALVYLNGTTDYLEGWFTTNAGTSATLTTGLANTYLSGEYVRP